MTNNPAGPHWKDPLFQNAMQHVQTGKWQEGLDELSQLLKNYPDSEDLQTLHAEMQLRARMDADELVERRREKSRKLKTWTVRLLALVVIVGLGYWGIQTYSGWIQRQLSSTSQTLEGELQKVSLSIRMREGQNLLEAGRLDLAAQVFQEVASADPNYPGLAAALDQVNNLQGLEAKYVSAVKQVEENNLESAMSLFKEIAAVAPGYKDVASQIKQLESRISLEDMFANAEKSYQAEEWAKAATQYETIRITDPLYKTDLIDQRLYLSYVNAAVDLLNSQNDSMENLENAEAYFRKALTLRPQDAAVQAQRELSREKFTKSLAHSYVSAAQKALQDQADSLIALKVAQYYFQKALELRPNDPDIQNQEMMSHLFIQAQAEFEQGNWDQVITLMEEIHQQDPNYAVGTARQTLFEAYLARGQAEMVTGEYELALADFQRAALLAKEVENALLQLYNAQIKIAEAQGVLGDYTAAVLLYQEVLENLNLSKDRLNGDPELSADLDLAAQYVRAKNDKAAFKVYRENASQALVIYGNLVNYVVQDGDYLPALANHFDTTISVILAANNLSSASHISAGDRLIIPKGKSWTDR
jgi:tetratricopeptide (TPR) repeat protein